MEAENRAIRRERKASPPTKIHILTKTVQNVHCINVVSVRPTVWIWTGVKVNVDFLIFQMLLEFNKLEAASMVSFKGEAN